MKYAIITPTFKPHFRFIKTYLKSYDKYVTDKEEIEIIFTISKNEQQEFHKIVKKYVHIKYRIVLFEDLLRKYNIRDTIDDLLFKYQKFTFQTLKKFYTMLDAEADYFLVLDSESMWIRPTRMTELFENYYKAPFLTFSSMHKRRLASDITRNIVKNTNYLLGEQCDKWFLENFVWFYDKHILNKLFDEVGSPIELANKIYNLKKPAQVQYGIFEIELYQNYIYNHNTEYKYQLFNADQLLATLPRSVYKQYLDSFYSWCQGHCGVLEQVMLFLTDNNYKLLANMFLQHHFTIVRCEFSDLHNYPLQYKWLQIARPNILAASQQHAFGINSPVTKLLRQTPAYLKMKKHMKRFSEFLNYLCEPVAIVYYAIKFLCYIPQFRRKYKK